MLTSISLATANVFLSAYAESDFFGKLIFLGLFALSIICWVVLVYKIWLIKKVKNISDRFQVAFEKYKEPILGLELANMPRLKQKEVPHPFAHIFSSLKQKTIEVLNKNHFFAAQSERAPGPVYLSQSDLEIVESCGLTAISSQIKELDKNIFILSTITTLAPFLGLLGTVWGILITFAELHGGGSASSNSVVLGGLSTALVTTVLGLLIAIPALVSHSYLKSAMRTLSSDMEDFLYLLLSNIELQYRKADVEAMRR
jgi:biopolymer transport protein TolQ